MMPCLNHVMSCQEIQRACTCWHRYSQNAFSMPSIHTAQLYICIRSSSTFVLEEHDVRIPTLLLHVCIFRSQADHGHIASHERNKNRKKSAGRMISLESRANETALFRHATSPKTVRTLILVLNLGQTSVTLPAMTARRPHSTASSGREAFTTG
jgi:hypothetical protein